MSIPIRRPIPGRPPLDAQGGDELHHFGWNACSTCHADEASRGAFVVPGLLSGRIHIIDAADPRAQASQGDRAREITPRRTLGAAHGPLPGRRDIMLSMLGDGEGNAPGGFLLLDESSRSPAAGRRSGGMQFNYDFWYQPRHNVMVTSELGAPTRSSGASASRTSPPASTAAPALLGLGSAEAGAEDRPGRKRPGSPGGPFPPRPRQHARFRRRGTVEHDVALLTRRRRAWQARPGHAVPSSTRAGPSRSGADHRSVPVDGRPVPLFLQLAARRHPTVRRQRPGATEAHRPGLARRRAGQAGTPSAGARDCAAVRRCCSSASTAGGCT